METSDPILLKADLSPLTWPFLACSTVEYVYPLYLLQNLLAHSNICNLVQLDLVNMGLINLEEHLIRKCSMVEDLNLTGNKFETIPYELQYLPKLKTLDMSSNPLVSFGRNRIMWFKDILPELKHIRLNKCGYFRI